MDRMPTYQKNGVTAHKTCVNNNESLVRKTSKPIRNIVMINLRTETNADELHNFEVYTDIVDALRPYIESAKTGNGKLSKTAFFDHAHIVGSVDGAFYNLDADTFSGLVTEGGESPNIKSHIAWIDVSGPAAAAKVEFIDWNGIRFTDFFVLYKHDGQWRISGKVYDSHSRN